MSEQLCQACSLAGQTITSPTWESGPRDYRTWWRRKVSFIYAHVCPRSTHTLVWVGWIAEASETSTLGYWVTHPLSVLPSVPTSWDIPETKHQTPHKPCTKQDMCKNPNVIPLSPQGHFIQLFTIKQCRVCLHWRLLVTKCYWEILTSLCNHSSGGIDVYHSNYCTLNP